MFLDEQQREKLTRAGFLPQPEVPTTGLVVRPGNLPAVVPHPAEDPASRSVAELSAAALNKAQRLAQLQARLAALCADHRVQGTCPGHCVRGSFG